MDHIYFYEWTSYRLNILHGTRAGFTSWWALGQPKIWWAPQVVAPSPSGAPPKWWAQGRVEGGPLGHGPPPQKSKFYIRYRTESEKSQRTTLDWPKNKGCPPLARFLNMPLGGPQSSGPQSSGPPSSVPKVEDGAQY